MITLYFIRILSSLSSCNREIERENEEKEVEISQREREREREREILQRI